MVRGGQVVLLGTDVQGSVLQALDGHGSQSFGYSPYGHRPPANTFLGFNGERPDPVTGHYWLGNGYRAFNPVLMRFNQPDSLSPFGRGGLNAYAYCSGDPVNRNDPSGHAPLSRVLGMRLSPFEKLPGEMHELIFKHLSKDELLNVSLTSSTMNNRVLGVSKTAKVDATDPEALLKIKQDLQGRRPDVLPARLKRDKSYKNTFEQAGRIQEEKMIEQRSVSEGNIQSFLDSVADKKGAQPLDYVKALTRKRRGYSSTPERLAELDSIPGRLNYLVSRHAMLLQEHERTRALIKKIRSNLVPR